MQPIVDDDALFGHSHAGGVKREIFDVRRASGTDQNLVDGNFVRAAGIRKVNRLAGSTALDAFDPAPVGALRL